MRLAVVDETQRFRCFTMPFEGLALAEKHPLLYYYDYPMVEYDKKRMISFIPMLDFHNIPVTTEMIAPPHSRTAKGRQDKDERQIKRHKA